MAPKGLSQTQERDDLSAIPLQDSAPGSSFDYDGNLVSIMTQTSEKSIWQRPVAKLPTFIILSAHRKREAEAQAVAFPEDAEADVSK